MYLVTGDGPWATGELRVGERGQRVPTCGVARRRGSCWGENSYGQLGTGTHFSAVVPTPVSGGLTFAQVTTGWDHTCGVTTTGAAYCWGNNSYGQLRRRTDPQVARIPHS